LDILVFGGLEQVDDTLGYYLQQKTTISNKTTVLKENDSFKRIVVLF